MLIFSNEVFFLFLTTFGCRRIDLIVFEFLRENIIVLLLVMLGQKFLLLVLFGVAVF